MGSKKRITKYVFSCLSCHNKFHPKAKDRNKFCSRECAFSYKRELSRLREARTKLIENLRRCKRCECCGNVYLGNGNAKYCSDNCRRTKWRGNESIAKKKKYISLELLCSICGSEFKTKYGDKTRKVCSLPCKNEAKRRQQRINEYNREKRIRKAFVEIVIPHQIYIRDHYQCQLCGDPLAMNEVVPHSKAPTIDHIIPLAKNGTHEPSNVQAAHFECNWRKRDAYDT